MARRKKSEPALRVAFGTRAEPFAGVWRFWTRGTSAYIAIRAIASTLKASFHPAGPDHPSANWTFGLTAESKQRFAELGSRRSNTWAQEAEFSPGWYRGPVISVPRLPDRPYDLPLSEAELGGVPDIQWVDPPAVGSAGFLGVFLSDDRPELPPLEIGDGKWLGSLPMSNGWHLSVVAHERPLREEELRPVYGLRDEMKLEVNEAPSPGAATASMTWVTTSPDGPPLFVQIVLGTDNFKVR
jgi:hypothetical protein